MTSVDVLRVRLEDKSLLSLTFDKKVRHVVQNKYSLFHEDTHSLKASANLCFAVS